MCIIIVYVRVCVSCRTEWCCASAKNSIMLPYMVRSSRLTLAGAEASLHNLLDCATSAIMDYFHAGGLISLSSPILSHLVHYHSSEIISPPKGSCLIHCLGWQYRLHDITNKYHYSVWILMSVRVLLECACVLIVYVPTFRV